jgi:hypothetical protein
MLTPLSKVPTTNGQVPAPTEVSTAIPVTGRDLRRLLRGASPTLRACVAADFAVGWRVLVDPLPTQAARLCGVNVSRVSAVLGNVGKRGPRASTIDRVIRKYGAEPLLKGIDRATAPVIAEEREVVS